MSVNILEENIDSDTQMEYFEYSRNFTTNKTEEEIIRDKENILDGNMPLEKKKLALTELASVNNIEAYRAIEKYLDQPNIKLYEWAYLALNECRLQLESNLLDEHKILITSGLGGKGFNLRYFVVLFTHDKKAINNVQKHIIEKELLYTLKGKLSELEDIEFDQSLASILCMIPLNVSPKALITEAIEQCNLFGNFLHTDFFITNMKVMGSNEIFKMLRAKNIY